MEIIKDPYDSAGEAKLYYKDLVIGNFQSYSLIFTSITDSTFNVYLKRGLVQLEYLQFLNTEEEQLSVNLFRYEESKDYESVLFLRYPSIKIKELNTLDKGYTAGNFKIINSLTFDHSN